MVGFFFIINCSGSGSKNFERENQKSCFPLSFHACLFACAFGSGAWTSVAPRPVSPDERLHDRAFNASTNSVLENWFLIKQFKHSHTTFERIDLSAKQADLDPRGTERYGQNAAFGRKALASFQSPRAIFTFPTGPCQTCEKSVITSSHNAYS